MEITNGDWIAIYAAVVATGALILEIRRWFTSGPRLFVTATPNITVLDGDKELERDLTVVKVVNRGSEPTTITGLGIVKFNGAWSRWRNEPVESFVVVQPYLTGTQPNIPSVLDVGSQWTGFIRPRPDLFGDIQSGQMWVSVHTTNRDYPYLARVPLRTSERAKQV